MTPIELGLLDAYAEHHGIPWEQGATLGTLDDYRHLIAKMTKHLPPGARQAAKAWALAYMQENTPA